MKEKAEGSGVNGNYSFYAAQGPAEGPQAAEQEPEREREILLRSKEAQEAGGGERP